MATHKIAWAATFVNTAACSKYSSMGKTGERTVVQMEQKRRNRTRSRSVVDRKSLRELYRAVNHADMDNWKEKKVRLQ
jgi:hypothetical protein